MLETFEPSLAESFVSAFEEVRHTGQSTKFRCALVHPPRRLSVEAAPSTDDGGRFDGVTFFARVDLPRVNLPDVEPAVDAGLELLGEVLGDVDHGVLVLGPGAEILSCNPKANELLGLSEAGLLGRSSMDPRWHVVREDGSPFPAAERPGPRAVATGRAVRNVTMGVHRPISGDIVWLRASSMPSLDARGAVRYVVCSFSDTTARRDALDSLRREHELLVEVMNTSAAGITVLDPDGRITWANPASEKLFGLPASDIAGRAYDAPEWRATDLDGGPLPDEAQPFVRVLRTRAPVVDVRHCIEAPDGTRRALSVNGAPILDEHGEVERLVFSASDITDRLETERDQSRMQRRVSELARFESLSVLAGGVAHDFNNLLMGILGGTGLALLDVPPGSRAREALELVERTTQTAASLTRQLLAYSGRGRFVVEPVDLTALVVEARALFEAVVGKNVSLCLETDRDLPPVEADATEIRQVLVNLVINGSDAIGGRPGRIVLRTGAMNADDAWLAESLIPDVRTQPGTFAYVEVEDDGEGMAPEALSRMFEPFTTTKPGGYGLGLPAVSGVVRGHRGFLRVWTRPGEGARFRIGLPARPQARVSVSELQVSAPDWRPPGCVLVVDDEPRVRQVVSRIITLAGGQVETAADGQHAIERALALGDELSAVILDLRMPGLGGRQVLARLRLESATLPVLLMSGYASPEELEAETTQGPTDFIHKPFRASELLQGLRALVERT